jgi:hypothetical protein
VEVYNKIIADDARKYRKDHPDVMKKLYEKAKKNPRRKYCTYIRSATSRNIEWDLSYDECVEYFTGTCDYCKIKQSEMNGYLLGIDRVDNDKCYQKSNCVACCMVCNMIKNDIELDTLLERSKHILSYLGIISEKYGNIGAFDNFMSSTYNEHFHDAKARKKENLLTKEQFNNIKKMYCYMCGKNNSDDHINGIDRVVNSIGYNINNCLACCGNCNYMKNKYHFHDVIIKLYQTYMNNCEDVNEEILSDEEVKKICDKHINKCFDKIKLIHEASSKETIVIIKNTKVSTKSDLIIPEEKAVKPLKKKKDKTISLKN